MTRFLLAVCCCLLLSSNGFTQNKQVPQKETSQEDVPYKILTNGRKITIQSKSNIQKLMLWSASGHRIVEENNLNTSSYSYTISIPEKVFFVMLQLANGKRYTKKIGVE
jgi:hypothetical protein